MASLLIASVLGGCAAPDEYTEDRRLVRGPLPISLPADVSRGCDDRIFRNCDEMEKDPTAPARVGGFDVSMEVQKEGPSAGFAGNGLIIKALDRDLIIEDMGFTGDGVGIEIQEQDACSACTVTIRDVRMEGVRGGFL